MREPIRRSAALLLTVIALLGTVALGACSSGATPSTTTPSTTKVAIHEGKVSGTFKSYEMVKDENAKDAELSPALKPTGNAWIDVDGQPILMKCPIQGLKVGAAVTARQSADGSWRVLGAK